MLPTPRTNSTTGAGQRGEGGPNLQTALSLIPTPASRDYKAGSVSNPYDTLDSLVETGATKGGDGKKTGLRLQPAFVEYLMGYPKSWTELTD
jgi:hypothetical protein